jgi:RNA polymerase sigma factor (sigma-70 family)
MATPPTNLPQRLLRLAGASDLAADEELLERFVRTRDECAFSALVERHGRMVLRLCWRVLGQGAAAEDAFQATLLVLARRAGSIRRPGALAAWLHGVAYRLALKARDAGERRREAPLPDLPQADPRPGPLDELTARELLAVLDEELDRLPQAHRLAVLLCCLEGRSLEEAARQVGCTVGSLRGRLERGRSRLRARLARRGLDLPTTLLPATLAQVPVPGGVLTTACRAALAAGPLGLGLSARAAALAEGAFKGTALPLKAAAATLVLALAALAAALLPWSKAPPPAPVRLSAAAGPARGPATDRHGDPLPAGAVARLGTERWQLGFDGPTFLSFTPDGHSLLSGCQEAALWDVTTGRRLRTFGSGFSALALSPDGKKLATAGPNKLLCLWDVDTGKELRRFTCSGDYCGALAFSPDGTMLAGGPQFWDDSKKAGGPQLWDAATGKLVRRFGGAALTVTGHSQALTFSPDGKTLAAVLSDKSLRLWEIRSGKELRELDSFSDRPVTFSPRGDGLAWVDADFRVCISGLGARARVIKLAGEFVHVECLAFSPDGQRLALSWGEGGIYFANSTGGFAFRNIVLPKREPATAIYDVTTGKLLRRFQGQRYAHNHFAFSPDGKTLATTFEGTIRLWDVDTGQERTPDQGHAGLVSALAFSRDGKGLVTAGFDDWTVRRWDATGKQLGRMVCCRSEPCFALSPGGKLVAAGTMDRTIRLWDVTSGMPLHQLMGQVVTYAMAFSADGKSLAAGGKGPLELWDVTTGRRLRSWPDAKQQVSIASLTFSPDGKVLAAGGWQRIILREIATGQERELPGHKKDRTIGALAYSPDGRFLASGRPTLRLWDVVQRKQVPGVFDQTERSTCSLAFTPDGRLLASGNSDGKIRFWEVATGQEVGQIVRPDWPAALAFSPDGRSLASAQRYGTALVWDLALLFHARAGASEDETLWANLSAGDARRAQRAVWALATVPRRAVALLEQRLRPMPRARAEAIRRHIGDLDSDVFATREAASAALAKLGLDAEPALRAALANRPSLEVASRIRKLLAALPPQKGPVRPVDLRSVRAVQALELSAAPETVQLLRRLAKGPPEDRLTQEAAAALRRLGGRSRP